MGREDSLKKEKWLTTDIDIYHTIFEEEIQTVFKTKQTKRKQNRLQKNIATAPN